MFSQRGMVVLAAGLLAAALCSPADAEDARAGLAPKTSRAAPAKPGPTADAMPAAGETAAQAMGIVGLEGPTRTTDKLARRMAERAPLQTPLILGVRF